MSLHFKTGPRKQLRQCQCCFHFALWRQIVLRVFAIGVVVGVLLVIGGTYYYFVSGMAPVATADNPLPYEKKIASKSKNAHMRKQTMPPSPVAPDEPNLLAGAKVYKE